MSTRPRQEARGPTRLQPASEKPLGHQGGRGRAAHRRLEGLRSSGSDRDGREEKELQGSPSNRLGRKPQDKEPQMRHQTFNRPSDDHATEHVVCFDIETIVDEEPADGSFPPWPRHRPVAAAFLSADWSADGRTRFALDTLICLPGEETKFYAEVDRLMPAGVTSVSYNGRGFDLPVLQLQAMAAGAFTLEGLYAHTHAPRYGARHCDLADQFAGYGGTRRVGLAELCETLAIPVKTSVHGADVGTLWRDGEVETIAAYVREDVVATYILWLHWAAARAGDERRIAEPLADLASFLESTSALAHLAGFATCRSARWARPRALLHRVTRARDDAARRVAQVADERAFAGEPPIF